MQFVVDHLWNALQNSGVSWLGFYLDQPGEPDDRRLVLGPHRDKPACSPIGLHGVCGKALVTGEVQIVRDVKNLGPNYIACDPRDRSEIVIPLFDHQSRSSRRSRGETKPQHVGGAWGLLDVDSFEAGAFDQRDAEGFALVLRAAGLMG